jgi:hypothetical protein
MTAFEQDHINRAECTVKKTPDDGQMNCPKYVDFLDKLNLGN